MRNIDKKLLYGNADGRLRFHRAACLLKFRVYERDHIRNGFFCGREGLSRHGRFFSFKIQRQHGNIVKLRRCACKRIDILSKRIQH